MVNYVNMKTDFFILMKYTLWSKDYELTGYSVAECFSFLNVHLNENETFPCIHYGFPYQNIELGLYYILLTIFVYFS